MSAPPRAVEVRACGPSNRVVIRPASPRRRLASAALLALIAAALTWLAFHHPREATIRPQCPSLSILGVYCPGCGSTRATHLVLQGNLDAAWRHNPALVLIGVPLLMWLIATLAIAMIAGRHITLRMPPVIGWIAAVLLVAYMVARNVEAANLEWLRPPTSST